MALITVNGDDRELNSATNVFELLAELGLQERRVAVMVNDAIVRREERTQTPLAAGDRIEIIQMVGGG